MAINVPENARQLAHGYELPDGWLELATQNLFYVRGLRTFKEHFGLTVSLLHPFVGPMRELLATQKGWGISALPWGQTFHPRQLGAAYRQEAISYDKAAQVILTCALAMQSTGGALGADWVFDNLRIQPALYLIRGYDKTTIERMRADPRGVGFFEYLRQQCGQEHVGVFVDMANGFLVTRNLAEEAQKLMTEAFTEFDIGTLAVPARGGRFQASPHEKLDTPRDNRRS